MKILGIAHDVYICSAAVVVDGEVVSAIPEERLDRKKQSRVFPTLAIQRCLGEAGLTMQDIDEIAVAWNPAIEVQATPAGYLDARRWRTEHLAQVPARLAGLLGTPPNGEMTLTNLAQDAPPITFVDHYHAHLGNALTVLCRRSRGVPGDGWSRRDAHGAERRLLRPRRGRAVRGAFPTFARALLRDGDAVPRLQAGFGRMEGDGPRVVRRRHGGHLRPTEQADRRRGRRNVPAGSRVFRALQLLGSSSVLGRVRRGVRSSASVRRADRGASRGVGGGDAARVRGDRHQAPHDAARALRPGQRGPLRRLLHEQRLQRDGQPGHAVLTRASSRGLRTTRARRSAPRSSCTPFARVAGPLSPRTTIGAPSTATTSAWRSPADTSCPAWRSSTTRRGEQRKSWPKVGSSDGSRAAWSSASARSGTDRSCWTRG